MSKIVPCLWFDGQAEEAAKFYAALIPDSRIDKVMRAPSDNPSTPEGAVLTVDFTLAGQQFIGLNGGPQFPFTKAVSEQFMKANPGINVTVESTGTGAGMKLFCAGVGGLDPNLGRPRPPVGCW